MQTPSFPPHRNIASQTVARLKDVARRISSCMEADHVSKERSASLDLLLRFQRLLVSKLYIGVDRAELVTGYSESCRSRRERWPKAPRASKGLEPIPPVTRRAAQLVPSPCL